MICISILSKYLIWQPEPLCLLIILFICFGAFCNLLLIYSALIIITLWILLIKLFFEETKRISFGSINEPSNEWVINRKMGGYYLFYLLGYKAYRLDRYYTRKCKCGKSVTQHTWNSILLSKKEYKNDEVLTLGFNGLRVHRIEDFPFIFLEK